MARSDRSVRCPCSVMGLLMQRRGNARDRVAIVIEQLLHFRDQLVDLIKKALPVRMGATGDERRRMLDRPNSPAMRAQRRTS